MIPPTLALALALGAGAQSDSVLIPRADLIRLYTDCDESRWPYDTAEQFVPKTTVELLEGVARRRRLEASWRALFASPGGDSVAPTPPERWAYPLAAPGRLRDNFAQPREDRRHEALDIFATEGTVVRSPVSGVVVAAGDGWRGGYTRGKGFFYEGDGLSRRAGNGVIIFEPASGGYILLAHLRAALRVSAGEIVRRGQAIGRVGHTGNASFPGRGRHLHLAFKRSGIGCGVEGVLVAENPYRWVRAARSRAASVPARPVPYRSGARAAGATLPARGRAPAGH